MRERLIFALGLILFPHCSRFNETLLLRSFDKRDHHVHKERVGYAENREKASNFELFSLAGSLAELGSDGRRVREALQEEVALWTVSTVLQVRVAPVRHEAVLALVALAVGKLDAQFRLDKQAVPDLGLPLGVELVRVRVRTVAHLAATFLEVVVHARVRFVQDHARRVPRRQRRDECAAGSFRETCIFQQASLDTRRRIASSLIEHARSSEPRRV